MELSDCGTFLTVWPDGSEQIGLWDTHSQLLNIQVLILRVRSTMLVSSHAEPPWVWVGHQRVLPLSFYLRNGGRQVILITK
jgi:hypothetical protein